MAETSKYLLAARQALQEENYEDAKKYYDMVKTDDPTNVEAKIQFQYCKFMDCTKGQAYNCYNDYMNVLNYAVENVAASDMPLEEQLKFLSTLVDNSIDAMKICFSSMNSIKVQGDDTYNKQHNLRRTNILFARDFGDAVAQKYADSTEGMQIACNAWKSFVNRANGSSCVTKQDGETVPSYAEKIQKIDPSYNFVPKKRGCF